MTNFLSLYFSSPTTPKRTPPPFPGGIKQFSMEYYLFQPIRDEANMLRSIASDALEEDRALFDDLMEQARILENRNFLYDEP